MPKEFEYYAFISYNHRDERAAKWLQRHLEHYRLPSVARMEIGADVRLRPIFRYAVNLSLSGLRDAIQKELERSKYLIVVCSPNSARPNIEGKHWVDDEVRRFIELGRKDRIIPVIVDGEPNVGGERECFPPVLRDAEIAAANLSGGSRESRRNDFLKIVAKLLGILPDQLIRHTEAEERRARLFKWLKVLPAVVLAAVGGLFAWDASRTVVNYYSDYVDSFGLPEGIFRLGKDQLRGRGIHYRFEYRGFQFGKSPHADSADRCVWNALGLRRRLVRVVQANSRGYPCTWDHAEYCDRSPIQDFRYDRDLRLREIRRGRYNGDGKEPSLEKRVELWNEAGTVNGLIKFFANEGQLGVDYSVASPTTRAISFSYESKSEIVQHVVRRDGKGRVEQLLFLNLSGANVPDGDGLYGFSYERDDMGRQTARWHLFRAGAGFERRSNKKGIAGRRYEYSGHNLAKVEYIDDSGRPVMGPSGWKVCRDSFDAFDNNTDTWYYDERGRKDLCSRGFAGSRAKYDCAGDMVSIVFLDAAGKPTLDKNGIAGWHAEYDGRGFLVRLAYIGVDGKPTLSKDGIAGFRKEYDACGNITRESFFGVDGRPTLQSNGSAGCTAEYDDDGREIRKVCFGIDGSPTLAKDGIAERRAEYDARGNVTRTSFFGTDGKPALRDDGVAEIRGEYDDRGNIMKVSLFGTDGKPTLNKEGIAEFRVEYDARGNVTRQSYFGADGNPILRKNGSSGWVADYDERGNMTRQLYFGTDGAAALNKDGYAELRTEYDDGGNITKMAYFGTDGKPILDNEGTAGFRVEYDAHGNITRRSCFGIDGSPTLCKRGFSELRMEYDAHGNPVKGSYYGVDGKLIVWFGGYACVMGEFDSRGNLTRALSLGVDGKPVLGEKGFAELRNEYDERGNMTKESYYGVEGEPTLGNEGFSSMRLEYDARDNVIKTTYYGVDGKLTLGKRGFAGIRKEYDERGRVVKVSYYGVDGSPISGDGGMHEIRREYDARGNMTEESYYGADGRPMLIKDGVAKFRNDYDEKDNLIKTSFFGVDGRPALCKKGYSVCRREFDDRGNMIRELYYGTDGTPTLDERGCAGVSFEHDAYGVVAGEAGCDLSGNAVVFRQVAFSAVVVSGLMADKYGVREGDIWCRLGSYDILESKNIYDLLAPLQMARNSEKELVVARKTGDGYVIHAFRFPVGMLGIKLKAKTIPDADKLLEAYKVFCRGEKSGPNGG